MVNIQFADVPPWLFAIGILGIVLIVSVQMLRGYPLMCHDNTILPSKPCELPSEDQEENYIVHVVGRGKWYQGSEDRKLIPNSEGICALTRVSGAFDGPADVVQVYRASSPEDGKQWWYIGGRARGHGLQAEATCFSVRRINS